MIRFEYLKQVCNANFSFILFIETIIPTYKSNQEESSNIMKEAIETDFEKKNYSENKLVNTHWLRFDVMVSFWGFHMKETTDRVVRVSFWERQVKELLGFYFEIDDCYVLKWEIISLIYK